MGKKKCPANFALRGFSEVRVAPVPSITVEPSMYREALALTVQSHRPDTEVLLVSEAALDGQVDGFAP